MLNDKGYTKTLTLLVFILILPISSSFASEDLSAVLKQRYETVTKEYSKSIINLQRGIAVSISSDVAVTAIPIAEGNRNVIAIDSKSKLAFIRSDTRLIPLQFNLPKQNEEIFFLLTLLQEPKLLLVKGKVQERVVKIEGNHSLGSLLLSVDLKPLGIVTESGSLSEVAIVEAYREEYSKFIKPRPVWLGIQAQTVTAELARVLGQSSGIVVTNVHEEGPAFKAGIRRGDIIIEAEKIGIKSVDEMQRFLRNRYPGEEITLVVFRDGEIKNFKVTLEELVEAQGRARQAEVSRLRGVEVSEIPESVKASMKKPIAGVLVRKVSEESPALGILKENDIIIEINRSSINNLSDFNRTLSQFEGRDLLILLYRGDSFQYVILPAQKSR